MLTLVSGIRRRAHLELDIVERCALRDLPVNAGGIIGGIGVSEVDYEVPDVAIEVVRVIIPLRAVASRDVRVDICMIDHY